MNTEAPLLDADIRQALDWLNDPENPNLRDGGRVWLASHARQMANVLLDARAVAKPAADKPIVAVHINNTDGRGLYIETLFCGEAEVLIIDDGCARDRVYLLEDQTPRTEIDELIGTDEIHRFNDGLLDEPTRKAIIAAVATAENGGKPKLTEV